MEPPQGSRARIRGHAIRRLAAASGDWRCDWAYIANTTDNRYLDLSDPFTAEQVWKQPFQPDLEQPESGQRSINPRVRRLLEVLRSRR